ncbi:MAG: hypothetical protein QOG03_1811 [Actinomycetota bacterium]|jgi:hypothetical protein|nr:hypothetical protein [Actinomycetota bacterium]
MAPELVPLCVATVHLKPPILMPGTPAGTRIIVEVDTWDVTGERINATAKGTGGADWLTVAPDGTFGTVDVRASWETDDGAAIFVQYNGRIDLSQQPPSVYSAPRFDTGDERYAWLNRVQAVAKGDVSADMSTIVYDMYEVR